MQISLKSGTSLSGPKKFRPHRNLLLGINTPSYWLPHSFLNIWKASGNFAVTFNDGSAEINAGQAYAAGILDANLELVSPVPANVKSLKRLVSSPTTHYAVGVTAYGSEPLKARWTGAATLVTTFGGTAASISGNTASWTSNGATHYVEFTVTDRNNPPRNIEVFQARHEAAVNAGKKCNPDWIAEIKDFGILRFMMTTNDSPIVEYAEIATEAYGFWFQHPSASTGPKGHMPLSLIKAVAVESGVPAIWVNFPHKASNDCATQIATYLRDNIPSSCTVYYEYSNETWNWGFAQSSWCDAEGKKLNPQLNWVQFQTRRATQIMAIVNQIYGPSGRSRWKGCLGVQTGWTSLSDSYYRPQLQATLTELGLQVGDCFDHVAVTNYFSHSPTGKYIQDISRANPAVVRCNGHGFSNGQEVVFGVGTGGDIDSGMYEIQGRYGTVTVIDANHFSVNIDTTGFTPAILNGSGNMPYAFAAKSEHWRVIDESEARHAADPATYPSKYHYFAEWTAQKSLEDVLVHKGWWTYIKNVFDPIGLTLICYEGGSHNVGLGSIPQYHGASRSPTNSRYNDFNSGAAHLRAMSKVYVQSDHEFKGIGGTYPAKFVEAGMPSQWGTWGGMRWLPFGDFDEVDDNPVWKATKAFNAVTIVPV